MENQIFLRLKNVNKVYPNGIQAVYDFNLLVNKEEFIVFVGPSGCGKSTTLRMIAGLEDITRGDLYIDQRLANNLSPKERDIAMVFQSYALYPHMNVYNNLAFGLKMRRVKENVLNSQGEVDLKIDDQQVKKINYPYADREFIANSFIIGNGRIGYKGTLEEEKALDKVTFNVVGVYDQYQSKWRESLNLFNPLYIALVNVKNKKIFHYKNAINHKLTLALNQGFFYRTSEFPELNIQSERFIHRKENLLISHYIVTIKSPIVLHLDCGIDQDIYAINGPHYRSIKLEKYNEMSNVEGITNEGHNVTVQLQQSVTINDQVIPIEIAKNHDYQFVQGDKIVITSFASVAIDDELRLDLTGLDYQKVKEEHIHLFQKRFSACRVMIENRAIQFAIDYSIYHLLILENEKYKISIPARGLSGQVYKGAIFWDTEIFMLPFYAVFREWSR